MLAAKDRFDVVSRAVAAADPHGLRRWSLQEAELMEIGVFRDDCESMLGGIGPHRSVIGRREPDGAHVCGPWKQVGEPLHEARREVLIE